MLQQKFAPRTGTGFSGPAPIQHTGLSTSQQRVERHRDVLPRVQATQNSEVARIQVYIFMLRIKFETSGEEGDLALNNILLFDSPNQISSQRKQTHRELNCLFQMFIFGQIKLMSTFYYLKLFIGLLAKGGVIFVCAV